MAKARHPTSLQNLMQRGFAAYERGRFAESLRLAQEMGQISGADYLCGLSYLGLNRFADAVACLERDLAARRAAGTEIDSALCYAFWRGYKAMGDATRAEFWIEQCLKQAPSYAAARMEWIAYLLSLHRYQEAAAQCHIILTSDGENAEAALYFAKSLLGLKKTQDATKILLALIDNANESFYRNDAFLLFVGISDVPITVRLESLNNFLAEFDQESVKNHPKNPRKNSTSSLLPFYYARAELLRDMGNIAEATGDYQKCLSIDPSDKMGAAAGLALIAADEYQPKAGNTLSDAHIAALFDEYAPRFDQHLTENLQYRAPSLLVAAILAMLRDKVTVLDLGCGTGLMGQKLREAAPSTIARLEGIDLSAAMLDKARASGHYDRLYLGNIVTEMEKMAAHGVDLVTAADVLVYLGDLAALFAQISRILARSGKFAFTVEEASQGQSDYVLQSSRRYAHHRDYLQKLAGQNGFSIITCDNVVLRQDQGQDVAGLLLVMERSEQNLRDG